MALTTCLDATCDASYTNCTHKSGIVGGEVGLVGEVTNMLNIIRHKQFSRSNFHHISAFQFVGMKVESTELKSSSVKAGWYFRGPLAGPTSRDRHPTNPTKKVRWSDRCLVRRVVGPTNIDGPTCR